MPVIHGGGGGGNSPVEPTLCAGCGAKIVDRYYLLAVDRQWHVRCLKCCECKLRLDSELTCFSREGNIYCKEDYYRLFAVKRCARCHLGISLNELVMRARDLVYHLHCFNCASCNKALTKGEQFGMKDNMVYCRLHYEVLLQADYGLLHDDGVYHHHHHHSHRTGASGRIPSFYNGVGTVQKGRPRKRKNHDPEVHAGLNGLSSTTLELLPDGSELCGVEQTAGSTGAGYDTTPTPPSMGGGAQHQPRTKRMRTSFKHHQLRTMKSYFALNQNPDAKDLKQLAQKTGLSKRVLQVWFQNARAKWRRNMMRQENQSCGDKSSSDSCPSGITDFGSSGSHLGGGGGGGDNSHHPMASTPTTPMDDIPPSALTSESQSPPSLTFGDLY